VEPTADTILFCTRVAIWRGKALEVAMKIIDQPSFNDAMLPDQKPPIKAFGLALILETLVIAIFLVSFILFPDKLQQLQMHYLSTRISAPSAAPRNPRPPKPKTSLQSHPEVTLPVEAATVPAPKLPSQSLRGPDLRAPMSKPPEASVALQPAVAPTNPGFAPESIPNLKKPRDPVQVGGFGDPNGVPPNPSAVRSPNVAQLGNFEVPAGGRGGTGGRARGTVHEGGFADAEAVAAPQSRQILTEPNSIPAEILYKPRPEYSALGRTKRIEGDVLLDVMFTASGEIKVLDIRKGLGFGLDESAEMAAQRIKFKPAQIDGRPVDSTAIVHIRFELAY
jgi:TonB family protein